MGIAREKKAQKIVMLDMQAISSFCDYFVILSATSLRQAQALAEAMAQDLAKERIKPLSKLNPTDESGWIVIDCLSVVAHIFIKPMREFYSLERLWSDAKRVRVPRNTA